MSKRKRQRANGTGSVYKRTGSAFYQMSYMVNGRTVRESTHQTNKERANDALKERLRKVGNGEFCGVAAEHTKVAELADVIKRDYKINGKKSLDDLETRWQLHLEPFFGKVRANEVNKDMLRRYVDGRQQQGASNATINRELAALKRMFNLGRGDKVMQVPSFPHLKENNIRTGFVEDHDYDKLAGACSKQGLWLRAMFETGYRIGWRVSELLSLRVGQVDLLNRTVRLEPGTTKNGRGRTAPIDDSLSIWLTQCVIGKEASDYVFSRDSDGLKPIVNFHKSWCRACVAVGLGKMLCRKCGTVIADGKCPQCNRELTMEEQKYVGLIFHDLRRTAIRNMTRSGIPERIAMTISGHETRSVFDRYDVSSPQDLSIAMERMNARAKVATHTLTHSQPKPAPAVVQQAAVIRDVLPN